MSTRPPSTAVPRLVLPTVDTARGTMVIVSGSFGAGHDAAAREIGVQLASADVPARVSDIVDFIRSPFGQVMRAGYLRQLTCAPATWGWLLRSLQNHEPLTGLVRRVVETAGEPVLELAAENPTRIVSTHPFASQVLGELRSSGRLTIPVVTYLTDMSVHRLWVHRGVDLHLAVHDLPAAQATALGAKDVRVVRPAVGAAFSSTTLSQWERAVFRAAVGLQPTGKPLALVTGGAFGIGQLAQSADDIRESGLAIPVVLCGHNDRLRRRLLRRGTGIALGWVSDLPHLLRCVDVVVQNAGGITSLESLATGTPTVTYRCLSGHGETNASALHRAGLVPWARDAQQLARWIAEALAVSAADRLPPADWIRRPDVADIVAGHVGAGAA